MTGLHAAFSAAAAAAAMLAALVLTVGGTFRTAFWLAAALELALAGAATRVSLPPHVEPPVADDPNPAAVAGPPLWRIGGVVLGLALAGTCFLGDGRLEGFSSLYLRG